MTLIAGLTKQFPGTLALDHVDFEDPVEPSPDDHRILDEFYVSGRSRVVNDREVRDVVYEAFTATGASTSNDTLFELWLERALHASYGRPPSWPPVYTRWSSG